MSKNTDLSKLLKGKKSGWISISKDYKKIIAQGKTLQELVKKLESKGNPEGYTMRASADFSRYVG